MSDAPCKGFSIRVTTIISLESKARIHFVCAVMRMRKVFVPSLTCSSVDHNIGGSAIIDLIQQHGTTRMIFSLLGQIPTLEAAGTMRIIIASHFTQVDVAYVVAKSAITLLEHERNCPKTRTWRLPLQSLYHAL
jgi:hypothetical protein